MGEIQGFIHGNGGKGAEGGTGMLDLHCPEFPEPSCGISEGFGDQKWQHVRRSGTSPDKTSLGEFVPQHELLPWIPSPTHPAGPGRDDPHNPAPAPCPETYPKKKSQMEKKSSQEIPVAASASLRIHSSASQGGIPGSAFTVDSLG